MKATDVAVIGGGQAGLALSRCLTECSLDHVVFERGDIAGRWETRTWDSLRLLTPNWLNTLPGLPYDGEDPDGFMVCGDFAARLRGYAAASAAPVLTHTEVSSVGRTCGGFLLATSTGPWRARSVVIATGHCDVPFMPLMARRAALPPVHSSEYRSPDALPPGKVLVIGASASGVQIADELRRSGRAVILAVGRHMRLPRAWRGRDIHRWLQQTGMLSQPTSELVSLETALREPTPQLAGRPDRADVDLASLQARGVRLAGRVIDAEGDVVTFADDLASDVAKADAKQRRVLEQIDAWAGLPPGLPEPSMPRVDLSRPTPRRLSLKEEGIGAMIWATGYRRDFGWLKLPVQTPEGELAHREGATPVRGLYALGFRLLRKRDSHFIGGVGSDAEAIAGEISEFLRNQGRRAA
ncbi:NAD(P)-binding domain-containing protein [Pseudaminobacter sp. 19-2017]|uniref:NAD(P)-binding domain-containing protein n=1 Tax=Pseudaminobacter soli (ex Zhang et al. 2022) TaxID=2831468 RepID=A0A942DXS5_9HYPH|nr:NAD(P)/FAD-dependent oxidoreductase [Pseudaminobacter soli]MBS3647306.1 NAD(P)-binding domain-containing protein [Pseudaminobacter soli]